MRRIKSMLLCVLMAAVIAGCGETGEIAAGVDNDPVITDRGASGSLSEGDLWKVEDTGKEKVRFSTGLEVVYPENWQGNTVLREESGTVAFCEKGNADAGIGGDLFYLCLTERTQGTLVLSDLSKVLGLYEQGDREYVLVQDQPGDRCYSEDEQSLIDTWQTLSGTIDNVIIKTDNMQGFTECGIEDLDWVQYESAWEDNEQSTNGSAENQNDMETIFVNRHGDVFNAEGDTVGIMATLKAFEWLVPRSSGECIADNLSAEENEFITESSKVLNNSGEAEDKVWIRITPGSVLQTEGSTIPHKDFLFYVVGEDAYVGIQSPTDNDLWAIWKMPDYGDWLEKEINIYIRMTTGL